MNKVFITGATGFIGSNLVKRLLADGDEIYALVRKPSNLFDERVKLVEGDILKPESFRSSIKGCDLIFHSAVHISFEGGGFQKAYEINVEGARNVLEAAYQAGVRKVVHVSSCAALGYSGSNGEVLDESADPQISRSEIYAYTKEKAEEVVREYVKKGMDISIANPVTVYGQGDRKLNSGSIIKAIYKNKVSLATPGGTSYVSVNDLIDGLMLVAQKGRRGERYIFCSENLTFLDLFNRIAAALGRNRVRYRVPGWTYRPAIATAYVINKLSRGEEGALNLITPQIVKRSYNYKYYSSKKAKEELGWIPKESIEDAAKKALEYYLEQGLIKRRRFKHG